MKHPLDPLTQAELADVAATIRASSAKARFVFMGTISHFLHHFPTDSWRCIDGERVLVALFGCNFRCRFRPATNEYSSIRTCILSHPLSLFVL